MSVTLKAIGNFKGNKMKDPDRSGGCDPGLGYWTSTVGGYDWGPGLAVLGGGPLLSNSFSQRTMLAVASPARVQVASVPVAAVAQLTAR